MINLETEISFTTSRSSGAGGQNVNKVNTRVTLRFDVMNSDVLNEQQKLIVFSQLQSRINKDGFLLIACEETRSQLKNKEIAIDLLHLLVQRALKPVVRRKATKPTRNSKLRRLQSKKIKGEKKANRRKPEL